MEGEELLEVVAEEVGAEEADGTEINAGNENK